MVARHQVAQELYNEPGIIRELGDLMPPLELQPEPSRLVIETEFLQIQPDSHNNGVRNPDGTC